MDPRQASSNPIVKWDDKADSDLLLLMPHVASMDVTQRQKNGVEQQIQVKVYYANGMAFGSLYTIRNPPFISSFHALGVDDYSDFLMG